MATIVELPRLSDTMEEGVIAAWHVAEGDKVKRGQLIADVETDKATMEFESFDAGTVLRLVAAEGDALPIGAAIAVLGEPGEDVDAALRAHGSSGASSASASRTAKTDGPSEDDDSSDDDDSSEQGRARQSGRASPRQSSEAGESSTSESSDSDPRRPDASASHASESSSDRIAASPVARRLAREQGIELSSVQGSGPHGRIVKADIESAKASPSGAASDEVDASGRPFVDRPDTPQRLSQMRKAIARRMARANTEIPHFYLTSVVAMDRSVALRQQLKDALSTKVSYNDLVLLATARALVEHPEVNAYWDGETIVQRGNVHLGMAVAVDEGLIVPVIRFAEQKTLREIAECAQDLGVRGREKKLRPEQMSGSTFTVSNLGMFGIDQFSAVINPGEGAILAVGAIADTVVVHDGQMTVGKRMKMTLACDHRVMDGASGAKFLSTVRGFLEQPLSMLA